MDFNTFLRKISINNSIKKNVLKICGDYSHKFDELYEELISRDADFDKIKKDLNDDNGLILLSIYLYKSFLNKKKYEELNIDRKIYFDTYECFSRFINETYKATNKYSFDRYWWVYRQTELKLFRIGTLEFEILNNGNEISIHVPSDANLKPQKVDKSLKKGKLFFEKIFKLKNFKFVFDSWLLSPKLDSILNEDSNIIKFKNRFEVTKIIKDSDDCIFWVFNTYSKEIKNFKEDTILQKMVKKMYLNNEHLGAAIGYLK